MIEKITSADGHKRSIGRHEFVVMMAAIMSLGALAIDGMLPALDEIARDLGVVDPNHRQLVVGLYLFASGIGCLFPGIFADRFGRRKVLFFALGFYITTSLLCALATSFEMLLTLRVIQGLGTAGLSVLPAAIIRDRFSGDQMARLMSVIFIVFMAVPVLAPAVGQTVLMFASWHWVFVTMAVLASVLWLWVWARLPETLDPETAQPISFGTVIKNMPLTVRTREAIGYVLASGLTFGAMFGYINSSQQLIGEHFGQDENFPLIFGATASTLALSSFINSRIVERFGARRVSHSALLAFLVVAALQVYTALYHSHSLYLFVPLMSANLCLLGFMGANFSSIAMQPFRETAGSASSVQAFIRMVLGAVIGMVIGQSYNDSALPLALALLLASCASLGLVLFSERGRLFRRPHDARHYMAMHTGN